MRSSGRNHGLLTVWDLSLLLARPIFMRAGHIFTENLVIATLIWQKLSSVEREVTLIVTHFWQLFSRIFGETSLIVRNIWRNLSSQEFRQRLIQRVCLSYPQALFPLEQLAKRKAMRGLEMCYFGPFPFPRQPSFLYVTLRVKGGAYHYGQTLG